jgi:hypothetical protein
VTPGADSQSGGTEAQAEKVGEAQLSPGITGVRLAEGLAGSDTVARLGSWEVEGDSIYAASRRGWLEYELTAPAADIYRIEIEGASRNPFDLDSGFYLVLSVDGESLGRVLLDAGPGRVGTVQALTPWLEAGRHRLRVFWDNVRKGRSLQSMPSACKPC